MFFSKRRKLRKLAKICAEELLLEEKYARLDERKRSLLNANTDTRFYLRDAGAIKRISRGYARPSDYRKLRRLGL